MTTGPVKFRQVETHEILSYALKRKWKYLLILAISFAAFSYLLKFKILDYSSTASFFVNDMDVLSSPQVDIKAFSNLNSGDNFGRVYQQVTSTTMKIHLINKFNLARHYGIDTTKEFHLQQTINELSHHLYVSKTNFNTINVTIKDKYRYFAPDIANEVLNYLNEMNQDYYVDVLKLKARVSKAYLEQLKGDNLILKGRLDSIIGSLTRISAIDSRGENFWSDQRFRFNQLSDKIENSTNELLSSQRLYNLSLEAMANKDFPAITKIDLAMPQANSNIFLAVGLALLSTIALGFLILFRIYFKLQYGPTIQHVLKSGQNN